jgi:hypothetical protein
MSLYYPPLDKKAYIAIWKMNLKRVKQMKPSVDIKDKRIVAFAKDPYKELGWNGRQICNAVQTALALAESRHNDLQSKGGQGNPDLSTPVVLDKREFVKVVKAAKEFETYMVDIFGGHDDADRAQMDQLRRDRIVTTRTGATAAKSELFGSSTAGSSASYDSSSESSSSDSGSKKSKKEKKKRSNAKKKKEPK